MSRFQELKDLFKRRLINAARAHLFEHFEESISGVENEIDHKRKLLDLVLYPDVKLQRTDADVQQLLESREEVPSSSRDHQDPDPLHIKDKHEEVWTSQEGELEEVNITKFILTPGRGKSEDDKEKPQSSHLHQRLTEEMETEADGEDCGGSEPDRNSHPDTHLLPDTDDKTSDSSDTDDKTSDSYEPDTGDSEIETEDGDEWKETSEAQSDLKSHVSCNTRKKSLSCSQCGKEFGHKGNLIIHQRMHTGERPFSCSVCGKKFTSKGNLMRHKKTHTGEKPFSCSICGKSFSYSILYYHMKTHTGEKPFSCTVCKKSFIQKARLLYHMRMHTGEKPFSCSVCGKKYANKVNLKYHMTIHTGEKPFSCSPCNKRFRSRPQLLYHKYRKCVSNSSQKHPYRERKKPLSFCECSECGKKFSQKSNLIIHQRTHTGEKPCTCSICGKGFISKGSLSTHMISHSGEKPFSCSICGKSFNQSGLRYHLKTHSGEKPFSCSLCGKTFIQKSSLKVHMKSHTGEKPFSCSVCGKKYAHKVNLESHMRMHTGEKPFSCTVCNKRFRSRSHRQGHKCADESLAKRSHIIRKTQVNCSECDATFPSSALLHIHMRTHRGLKVYTCSVCGLVFGCESTFATHMKNHSSETPYSCSLCDKSFKHNRGLVRHMARHKKLDEKQQSRTLDPERHPKPDTYKKSLVSSDTNGSADISFWNETRKHQSGITYQRNKDVSVSEEGFQSGIKPIVPKTGNSVHSDFGKRMTHKGIMPHMEVHSGKKSLNCSDCGQTFLGQFQLKTHKCGGGSLQRSKTGFKEEDCGGSKQANKLDPERHSKPDTDKKTLVSHETNDSAGISFWKETSQHQSGVTHQRNKDVSVSNGLQTDKKPLSCSDNKAQSEPKTSVQSEFSKQTRQHQRHSNDSNNGRVSVIDLKMNTGEKPSNSEYHKMSAHSQNEQTHTKCHTGEKLFSCLVCEKSFTLESELGSHKCDGESSQLPQSQTKERINARGESCTKGFTFCCSVCNKGFNESEPLVKHMRSHADHKPFCCSICGKEFTWRRYLTKHMEIHTKPFFSCTRCDRVFGSERQLYVHLAAHNRKKKIYRCTVCDEKFAKYDKLRTHMRRHTGKELKEAYMSKFTFTRVPKKSGDDEEKPQSSHLHQRLTEQMETEADGEDCGGSEPDTHLQPDTDDKTSDSSEPDTDDSDFWTETTQPPSVSDSHVRCDTDRKPLKTSESDQAFTEGESLSQCMALHTEVKKEVPDPPHIKEEHEEVWTSQEGDQLQGLEEVDITKFTFTPVPVKSEDDEEKPQSSHLHQRLTEQMETEADGEDCGGSEPDRNSHPDTHLLPDTDDKTSNCSEPDSDDSDFFKLYEK